MEYELVGVRGEVLCLVVGQGAWRSVYPSGNVNFLVEHAESVSGLTVLAECFSVVTRVDHDGSLAGIASAKVFEHCCDVEVLLVSPSKTLSQVAMYTLRACGYRVTTARSAWEAIEIAVRAQPDLIITSAVMAGVSGVDLVRALASMTATEGVPVAVLTSFSKDHQELQKLPDGAPVIRLGDNFDDDLADIITQYGLV